MGSPSARPPRSPADIRSDIADVERELREVPPHSGSSQALEDSLERLHAELRRAEAERTAGGS